MIDVYATAERLHAAGMVSGDIPEIMAAAHIDQLQAEAVDVCLESMEAAYGEEEDE